MFKGNPHGCSKYNNGQQQKFYDQLIGEIGPVMCAAVENTIFCNGEWVDDPEDFQTKLCGDLGPGKNFLFDYCN